jgi:hypothetical protein
MFISLLGQVGGEAIGAATGMGTVGRGFARLLGGESGGLSGEESTGELLAMQKEMQQNSFYFSTSSAIQSAEHEARMSVVRQIKV